MSQHDPHDVRLYDNVHVVPHEMDGMAGLMGHQADHYDQIANYVQNECGDTSGLTNLMSLMSGPVRDLADLLHGQYRGCSRRMDQTVQSLHLAKRYFLGTDEASAEALRNTYLFDTVRGYESFQLYRMSLPPNLTNISYSSGYEDRWSGVKNAGSGNQNSSAKSVPDWISDDLKHTQDAFDMMDPSKDLVAILAKPLFGNYDLLSDYASRYDNVGNATYQIAENIRRGARRIGPRWSGDGAAQFESNALMWNQGTGGLGDVTELCSQLFSWLYGKVFDAVNKVLDKAVEMSGIRDWIMDRLWSKGPEAVTFFKVHGPALIKCAPIRPPKTLTKTDVMDVARRLFELRRKFNEAKKIVDDVKKFYDDAQKKANRIYAIVPAARTADRTSSLFGPANEDPAKRASLYENTERKNGKYSSDTWNPALSAWRVGLLPQW